MNYKILFFIVLISVCYYSIDAKKKSIKDWNKVDPDTISKEWEEDDEPEELEHEYERIQRIQQEKQQSMKFDMNSEKGRAE
jgi:hypothetical protein